ncbi:amidase signature domain-containing protein [Fusarium napiforme]|uniref:Amidase signature domain-containing protein n=1 Tax=Fusarium napiforme TaxID=42672 RepID=A0A8H5NER7_9HYPO|nr:amidase signature domain-containing protein [Fusarium napiforme]
MGSRSSLVVDGVSYLVHPQSLLKIAESTGLDPIPVVLLPIGDSSSSVDDALQLINRFAEVDDVYSPSFSRTAVVRSSSERSFMEVLKKLEASGHFSAVYHVSPSSSQDCLPAGPYFLCDGGIHQAYRLYEDTLDSFIFGVIPDDVLHPKRYTPLNLLSSNGLWKSIPVPSRLYNVRTSKSPLSGARMGIKDIFRLEGTQTTMMSRPWIELYDPDEQSADYTKKLIKLGAVIVGKTKMTSFASPEEPTDQWVDFHCSVNPRGDGYQSPSSSSTGAATSLAGYEWLDFSIARDSAGSVRAPAPCNGLFSLRPSFGSTSMNGIPVNSPAFDTVGQFGRSLDDLHFIVSHTFENIHQTFSEFPTKILYPKEFYPLANREQQAMTEEYVKILEDFLGVKRTPFSFVEEWEKNPPQAAGDLSLLEYTEKSAFWSLCYDYYHGFDSFRDEYSAKFGKKPFVSSVVRFRWDVGKEVTSQEPFLTPSSSCPTENPIQSIAEANPPAGTFPTIAGKFISPILHAPQLVLPFAQMPYLSKISGRPEMRPIASTMIGAKGSDLMLIKFATEAFKKAGWPTSIQTGRYMYPAAENARNVDSTPIDRPLTFEMRQTLWETLGVPGDYVDDCGKSNTSVCNVV